METSLETLKNRINKKGYLESKITEMFLDNTSRLTFQLVPDKNFYELPEGLDMKKAPIAEPTAVSLHAVELSEKSMNKPITKKQKEK